MAYDIVLGRTKKDKEFGLDGTIYLGKHYVQMGSTTALSNKIFLDMIRSHVVFVCGKRGGGKCLHGDALITLDTGEVVPIRNLEENDGKVLALGTDLKIKENHREGFYRRKVDTLLRVKLRTGKEIKVTTEHPLLTVEGWRPAGNLLIGSRIATPRKEPTFGDRQLPEHEVKLLAYFLAEGHMKGTFILFSNTDPTIVSDFRQAIEKFNPLYDIREHGKAGCYRIAGKVQRKPAPHVVRDKYGRFTKGSKIDMRSDLRKLLDKHRMHGKLAKERSMPDAVFRLPKHQLSLFMNRLFSCDGCICEKETGYWQISYSSASPAFIRSISHFLLRFGIVSRIRKKYAKPSKSYSYEIVISGEFVHTFLQEIGFFGKKERRARKALKESLRIVRNPNTDTIPKELWERYKPKSWTRVGKELGYKHPKSMRESMRHSPSRQKLLQIARADQNEAIEALATSDIYWDEIVSIEKLEGEFTVYDITVPDAHNFIANDIIVHNSYSLGVMAEGMASLPEHIKRNLSIVMLDTMGVFWTMKYPNTKERELLEKWEMEPEGLDVTIFTPAGYYDTAKKEGIPTDRKFAIRPSELLGSDWTRTFGLDENSEPAVVIERAVHDLRERQETFSIEDILASIERSDASRTAKSVVRNNFLAASGWGLFSSEGTPMADLAKGGQVSILDLSAYATQERGWAIKSLVTGIVSQKLFLQRMAARKEEEFKQVYRDVNYLAVEEELEQKFPMVWLVLDEAHEFLPNRGKTLATDPLVTILREGRQPGISLVLASQQPGKIHTDVMTQSDIVLSHRITAKLDTDALGALMQSYMRKGLDQLLDGLPRLPGAALVLDDNNEKMFPMQVRPRFTWHGGEDPVALKKAKELFDF